MSSITLSVVQFVTVPSKINSSEEEKLEQFAQFVCNNIFHWVQNICEISHFTKQKQNKKSSQPQHVHKCESTISRMNKYLLAGSNRRNSRTWNHRSCVRSTFMAFCKYIFLQVNSSDFLFHSSVAVGTVSDPAVTDWTVFFPFPILSHAFVWNCYFYMTMTIALFFTGTQLCASLKQKSEAFLSP